MATRLKTVSVNKHLPQAATNNSTVNEAVPTPAKNPKHLLGNLLLILALGCLLTPWLAAAGFGFTRPGQGFTLDPLFEVLSSENALRSIQNTLFLAVAATVVMLALLTPTVIFLNYKAPRLARIAEFCSVLPMVIPAIALVSGVSEFYRVVLPSLLNSIWALVPLYVVLALPLCYRALDAGVKALDLRTIFAAASSLGAGTAHTIWHAIMPNLKVAMLQAALLCVALSISEFAIASLLLHYTFPVYLVEVASVSPRGVAALSFITTVITWLLLNAISLLNRKPKNTKENL